MTCSTKLKEFLDSLEWKTKDNVSEAKIDTHTYQQVSLQFNLEIGKSIDCGDFELEIINNPNALEVVSLGQNNEFCILRKIFK